MSTEESPRFMENYLQHGLNVLDDAKHIPKVFFKEAKGVMLISAHEGGFLVSNTSGTGVLIPHKEDGTWGMPMAVHLEGYAIGAVFGYANKNVVVIMNHFAMNRLLEGRGQTKLGVDVGFACGKSLDMSTDALACILFLSHHHLACSFE
jgi:lipid-binding SYLF domain-containing protein